MSAGFHIRANIGATCHEQNPGLVFYMPASLRFQEALERVHLTAGSFYDNRDVLHCHTCLSDPFQRCGENLGDCFVSSLLGFNDTRTTNAAHVNRPFHSKAELGSHANLSRQCSFLGEIQFWRRTVQGPPCVGYTSPEVPFAWHRGRSENFRGSSPKAKRWITKGKIRMHETEIRTRKTNTLLRHSGKRGLGQRTQLRFPATSKWA
ncbi:hypothetical protein JVT61DRAFT_3609 [Boletus reticuloceps]|uniref:Uncharacterized protein n=1 Tax=Boletus reticuloceps TaxID=495285 RepID=A0A8I2YN43_9AGAM|nr:hypothetical protein JVT61DRAFT_3609 [Boletus reticuloceps]